MATRFFCSSYSVSLLSVLCSEISWLNANSIYDLFKWTKSSSPYHSMHLACMLIFGARHLVALNVEYLLHLRAFLRWIRLMMSSYWPCFWKRGASSEKLIALGRQSESERSQLIEVLDKFDPLNNWAMLQALNWFCLVLSSYLISAEADYFLFPTFSSTL